MAPYIAERTWHPSQTLVPRDDGSVEITFRSHGGIEVRNFILSWQPHIRVLAPKRLRKQVVETMRRGIECNERRLPRSPGE